MSRASHLARSLYGSVQQALASRQALGSASHLGQSLLDQPSTSGAGMSSNMHIVSYGYGGLAAAGLGLQHLPTAGQCRHISFWRRSPPSSAEQDLGSSPGGDISLASTSDAPADVPVEPAGFFPLPEDSLEVFGAIQSACGALEKASILAAKADTWFMPSWFISALQMFHDTLGTPWCVRAGAAAMPGARHGARHECVHWLAGWRCMTPCTVCMRACALRAMGLS